MPPPAPLTKQALLFLCHLTEPDHVQRFKQLERAFRPFGDAWFVFDSTRHAPPPLVQAELHHTFSLDSLKALGYRWRHPELMPGHVHFPVLEFFKAHRHYSRYWVVEYDVGFTGPWRLFFRLANRSRADLIATQLASRSEQPGWYWWDSLQAPAHEALPDPLYRCFAPICRLSNPALSFLDTKLQAGWLGHQEVVLPTLLAHHGFQIEDLGPAKSFPSTTPWPWYAERSTGEDGQLNASSMRFKPPFEALGTRPLTLYHPLKTPSAHTPPGLLRLIRRFYP